MKALRIADSATVVLGLQDEIRRCEESRYDHRLHGVLLVAQGLTCPEVAALLGDASRSVEYWVRRFEEAGLAGLQEGERPGRPSRLSPKQLGEVDAVLRQAPREVGMAGKTLAAWIERQYGARLGGSPVSESISTIGVPFTETASHGGLVLQLQISDKLNSLWDVVLRSLPWRSDYRVGSASCCGRMG